MNTDKAQAAISRSVPTHGHDEAATGESVAVSLGRHHGGDLMCKLAHVAAGRLLLQANSGGGKTWLLRRLLEQSWGSIQQIVIDPDGQLATLGAVFGHLVLDAEQLRSVDPADLARSVREQRYSVVLDLSLADEDEKLEFVRDFSIGLLDCPQYMWRSALVVVDEAQTLAPFGATTADDATRKTCVKALADLNGRGRKRGLALVVSTTRIALASKGVISGIQNFLIGGCSLDLDAKRAADMLGLAPGDRDIVQKLPAGQFIAFGPALSNAPQRFAVGPVSSPHPGTPPIETPPALGAADSLRIFAAIPKRPEEVRLVDVVAFAALHGVIDRFLPMTRSQESRSGKRTRGRAGKAVKNGAGRCADTVERRLGPSFLIDAHGLCKDVNAIRESLGLGPFRMLDVEADAKRKRIEWNAIDDARSRASARASEKAPAPARTEGAVPEAPAARSAPRPADGDPEPERPAPARVPPVSLEARVAVLDSTLSLVDAAGILGVGVDDVARAAARSGKRFERSELPIRVSMSDVTDYLACEGFEVMPKSAGGYIVDRRHSFDEFHLVGFANRRRAAAGLPKFSVAAGSGPVQRGSLRHGEPVAHL